MLSAALILAVMVTPFISSLAREVLKAVPRTQREGAYALGATQWEAIRVALAYGRTGIVGAIMLGFGRALGETMAVTMVIGNNPTVSLVALRTAVHDGRGHRERIHRSHRRSAPSRADRDRPGAVRHHAGRQCPFADADLEHEPAARIAKAKPKAEPAVLGERGMTRNAPTPHRLAHRRHACALLSVIIALVPLAFILFFVVTQGRRALNWDFFTQLPKPVGETGRRHGQRHRGHADAVGPGRDVRDSRRHHERRLHVGVRRHAGSRRQSGSRQTR